MFLRVVLIIVLFCLPFQAFSNVNVDHLDTTVNDSGQLEPTKDNHHCYRYIFLQSGIGLPKKNLYYHNFNFFMNDFQYGITDNFTLAAGLILPFYGYISPKYTVEVAPKQHLMIGAIGITSMFLSETKKLKANLMYAGYSFGDEFNHFSVCMGYLNGSFMPEGSLMYNFGGSLRLAPTVYLIGECWINGGKQTMTNVSKWELDASGQKILIDPADPLNSLYKTKHGNIELNRTTIFANVQLRLISNKNDTKSWSFGIAYYSNWGGEYQEQSANGDFRNLSNFFALPLPSISFTQKIGKVEPHIPF
jgi:hypothetical protein